MANHSTQLLAHLDAGMCVAVRESTTSRPTSALTAFPVADVAVAVFTAQLVLCLFVRWHIIHAVRRGPKSVAGAERARMRKVSAEATRCAHEHKLLVFCRPRFALAILSCFKFSKLSARVPKQGCEACPIFPI
jgi:hypothetical protein